MTTVRKSETARKKNMQTWLKPYENVATNVSIVAKENSGYTYI